MVAFCMAFVAGFYFVFHSYTVFFLEMNYGYNMAINIALGLYFLSIDDINILY